MPANGKSPGRFISSRQQTDIQKTTGAVFPPCILYICSFQISAIMKMKYIYSLLIFFLCLGCKKETPDPAPSGGPSVHGTNNGNNNNNQIPASLNVSPSFLSFNASSGYNMVVVESNVNWSVSSHHSWISVSPGSGSQNGSFRVNVTSHSGSGERGGTITVSGDGLQKTISVSQSGNPNANKKGKVTFYKGANQYNPISFYFDGSYKGTLGPASRYQGSPGCYASGCITIDNLPYGRTYSFVGKIYNAAGTSVLLTHSGSVTIDSDCKTILVNPY